MSSLKRLISEIHHRSLWQVLLIYIGGALVAYQVVQALTEGLGLPHWFPGLAVVLFIIGLPIVVATALVQEVASPVATPAAEPEKVEAEAASARQVTRKRHRMTWRNAGLSFLVALAVWGVVATGWLLLGGQSAVSEVERKSIAVLPFENLSADPDDAYFTDGIHDEILTHLQKIADLKVISRTSVMEYRDREENVRTIAEELGVTHVLEGSVRRAGDDVRITTQLIAAEEDEHLWAENYQRELTDIFAVQADIAGRIAVALRTTLTAQERVQIEKVPTENLEAYDFYLRGKEYKERAGRDNFLIAEEMLLRAVELDPRFALAYARLSSLHSYFHWWSIDRSEERERQSRAAAERALQVDPDLPEGHIALGQYYYLIHRDYDRALEELTIAERGLPGEATVLHWRGLIWRRQGKWDEALASQERAVALSPREPEVLLELGTTYSALRRYEEAETYYDKAIALQPDFVGLALLRAMVPFYDRGDTGPFRTILEGIPAGYDPVGVLTLSQWFLEYLDRDHAAALEVLSSSGLEYFEWGDVMATSAPKTLFIGVSYAAMGETDLAQAAADSARRDLEARLLDWPDDPRLHSALSSAHAVMGHKEEAILEARRAVGLLPISKDAVYGPRYVMNLANIYARFGEVDAAVEQYERYLSVPAPGSTKYILLDPAIDPIRDHPRFQALLEKYE